MVRYPTTDKVAIENDGDIELNTGTVASAKVLTTADIFVDGSTEGLLAQLTSLANRVNQLETKLAALEAERPLTSSSTSIEDVFDSAECDLNGWVGYYHSPAYYEEIPTSRIVVDATCFPCGELGFSLGGIYDRGEVRDMTGTKIVSLLEKTYTDLPRHSALRLTFRLTIIRPYSVNEYAQSRHLWKHDSRFGVFEPKILVDYKVVHRSNFIAESATGKIPCLGESSPAGCTQEPVKQCGEPASNADDKGDFNYDVTILVLHDSDVVTLAVTAPRELHSPWEQYWVSDRSWGLRSVLVEPIFL